MCTSRAASAPLRSPSLLLPLYLPSPISAICALETPTTVKLSASLTATILPSGTLTVITLFSSFSTVPRTRAGGGGVWAKVARAKAASSIPAKIRFMGVSFESWAIVAAPDGTDTSASATNDIVRPGLMRGGMRVVVIGGYGNFGARVCRGIAASGMEVVAAGRNPDEGNGAFGDLPVRHARLDHSAPDFISVLM